MPAFKNGRYAAFYDNQLLGWPIKEGCTRFAGSYHFGMSVNIFDQIEKKNIWNTSDALSLQYFKKARILLRRL
jgi:L-rhamnose isomerase